MPDMKSFVVVLAVLEAVAFASGRKSRKGIFDTSSETQTVDEDFLVDLGLIKRSSGRSRGRSKTIKTRSPRMASPDIRTSSGTPQRGRYIEDFDRVYFGEEDIDSSDFVDVHEPPRKKRKTQNQPEITYAARTRAGRKRTVRDSSERHYDPQPPNSPPGSGDAPDKGIRNSGNTCYLNSAIQFLYHIPEFKETLGNLITDEDFQGLAENDDQFSTFRYEAVTELKSIFDRLDAQNGKKVINIRLFAEMMDKFTKYRRHGDNVYFKLGRPHDADEMVYEIMHLMDMQGKEIFKKFEFSETKTRKFQGCGHCKQGVETKTRLDISLAELKENHIRLQDLQSLVDLKLQNSQEPGDHPPIMCPICEKKMAESGETDEALWEVEQNFSEETRLMGFSDILLITLNRGWGRYNQKTQTYETGKYQDAIEIPQYLQVPGAVYELLGYFEHHGGHDKGGHYTCFAKSARDGEYYHFDDPKVQKVDINAESRQQAYMIAYKRTNIEY